MAYRKLDNRHRDPLVAWIEDVERRIKRLEERRNPVPDPGWQLVEMGNTMKYIYIPSGAEGPVIGVK